MKVTLLVTFAITLAMKILTTQTNLSVKTITPVFLVLPPKLLMFVAMM